MAIHVSEYPEEDVKIRVGKIDGIQKALPRHFELSFGPGLARISAKSPPKHSDYLCFFDKGRTKIYDFGTEYAFVHGSLNMIVLRKSAPESVKAEISNALVPLGYKISERQYCTRTEFDGAGNDVPLLIYGPKECKVHEKDYDGIAKAVEGLFSLEQVYLKSLIERFGLISGPVQELLKGVLPYNPDILSYTFAVYNPETILYDLYMTASESDLVDSFIESIASNYYNNVSRIIEVPNNEGIDLEVLEDKVSKMNLPSNLAVALASRVAMTDGTVKHIPMIDFREGTDYFTQGSDSDYETATQLIKDPIIAASSYNSLHAYGTKLQTPEQWKEFLKRMSLQKNIGRFWPKLQELQGFSLLRVTACDKKPYFPEILE